MKPVPILLVLAVLALAACAKAPPRHWRHADLPPDQWADDVSACKRWANRQVEREAGYDGGSAPRGGYGAARGSTLSSDLRTYDLRRRVETLTGDCLRQKGYVPAGK